MKTWCVYKHTCKTTGLSYIGITSRKPEIRWGNNGEKYKPHEKENKNRHFWNAICQYGWDDFTHEILETELSVDEANEREKYYIQKYDSYNNGYNSTLGGEGRLGNKQSLETRKKMSRTRTGMKHSKEHNEHIRDAQICKRPVICLETGKIYSNPRECAADINTGFREVLAICKGKHLTLKGYHFQYADEKIQTIEEIESKRKKHGHMRAIKCVETGEIYESAAECARKNGLTHSPIQKSCKRYVPAGGKHYIYADDTTPTDVILKDKRTSVGHKVRCIELDKVFDSVKECSQYFKVNPPVICSHCKSGKPIESIGNYHFEYAGKNPRKRGVICIETQEVFKTQKECAEHFGISDSMVHEVVKGKIESTHGYTFKYCEEVI